MADYGTIGVCYLPSKQYAQVGTSRCSTARIRLLDSLFAPAVSTVAFNPSRRVSGTVSQNGSPVSRLVRVYCRDTGELLRFGYSNPSTGEFSIHVGPFTGKVYVIAFDDTGTSPDYNAQILDLVNPG